jgi:hypothetical protein
MRGSSNKLVTIVWGGGGQASAFSRIFGETKIKKKRHQIIFKNVFLYPEYRTLINKSSLARFKR